jgi:hypothetical protein
MDVETQLWHGEENHEMVIRLAEAARLKGIALSQLLLVVMLRSIAKSAETRR